MRLLVDNALSIIVAKRLSDAGYDAVHVRDVNLAAASDLEILGYATETERLIISADTDFGTILALRQSAKPSFVPLRGDVERHPVKQAEMLLDQLPKVKEHLEAGAVAVITSDRVRIRSLPIASD